MAPANETKLKQNKALRQVQVDQVEEIAALAQLAVTDMSLHVRFKLRCESLDELCSEFQKLHNSIVSLIAVNEDPDFETEKQIRASFFDSYYTIKTIYSNLFQAEAKAEPKTSTPNVKLPKISLPTFDGSYRNWPTFFDLFKTLIHQNESLSNVEKFQYLIGAVTAQPLAIIKNIPITADNYPIAFRSLIERYQNKRMLANACWREIVNAPRLTSESPSGLRKILEIFSENLSALENLGLPVKEWDFILFHLMCHNLDPNTIKRFELEEASTDLPSYVRLQSFLSKQCVALETLAVSKSSSFKKPHSMNQQKSSSCSSRGNSFLARTTKKLFCNYCEGDHLIYRCPSYNRKEVKERLAIAEERKWCMNCLHSAHNVGNCSSKSLCRHCSGKHHTLLHVFKPTVAPSETSFQGESQPATVGSSQIHTLSNISTSRLSVLLATAKVEVLDSRGFPHKIRVLLDNGSQTNVITKNCLRKLGFKPSRFSSTVTGLGDVCSPVSQVISCHVRPVGQRVPSFEIEAVVLNKICGNLPSEPIPKENLDYLTHLKLADPEFNIPGSIDMLLGADLFSLVLTEGKIVGNNGPVAINTIFGWILMGKVTQSSNHHPTSLFIATPDTDSILKAFWELEEIPEAPCLSKEDIQCENLFLETYSREDSGRYMVALPFKGPEPIFGDTRSNALKRFHHLEKRLMRTEALHKEYCDFLKDYLSQGHMVPVHSPPQTPGKVFYIPHHSVLNPNSSTTRLRVVFDASAHSPEGISLNQTMLTGPKLQKDIVQILLHFRLHYCVFTADIKQMYRQISIVPSHRDYQRIVWRFKPTEPIQEFQLTTVTFGLSSSPFLALRTLKQLTEDEGRDFPLASEVLQTDVFVDDIISGGPSVAHCIEIKNQLIALGEKGKFTLHKWSSNNQHFLESISPEARQTGSYSLDEEPTVKVLGLQWSPGNDMFSYSFQVVNKLCSKRSILSDMARIFDPLGFLAPIVFYAKSLMQVIWTLGLEWDETPPPQIVKQWDKFKSQLPHLSSLKIPRWCVPPSFQSCEIHGFCDSSEKGYAACVYLRFSLSNHKYSVSLVGAKTKVAPLKRIALPRLELCAASLLAKLISFVVQSYSGKLKFEQIYAWSDSMVALSWIRSPPYKFKTFVANRVSYVQEKVPPECWYHIPSKENPADAASRGLFPEEFLKHPLWWAGPPWLMKARDSWPTVSSKCVSVPSDEERHLVLTNMVTHEYLDTLLEKYSSLNKIKRIIAYCLKFFKMLRHQTDRHSPHFTESDLNEALMLLVRRVQYSCFLSIYERIKAGEKLPKSFRKLSPFIDPQGIIRVGGRLTHANLLYDQRFPALLPSKSRLTYLIIQNIHESALHAGLRTVQFLLSQNFWVLSPRRAIQHVLSRCFRCFRAKPTPFQPPMGDLPAVRINQVKAFQHTGVDFGGPFYVAMTKGRGMKTQKAYLCLFVCFTTKALHLELASELTSDAFIAALQRFIGRRGRCTSLYSDRGLNFVGAEKQLFQLMKEASESERIRWSFNPPSAPHFGGLWEAGIKAVKSHLRRIVGEQRLTYEELNTVLIQIENILNSRPLCPLSSDPNDLSVLTPGHFLLLEPPTTIPYPDLTPINLNHLSRWQLLQRMHQDFWRRWHVEYLHTLQQKQKWLDSEFPEISPGLMVLIKDELASPLRWRLGRVEKIHPGSDGVCRVASVRTSSGLLQRPLVKLCPLPNQNIQ